MDPSNKPLPLPNNELLTCVCSLGGDSFPQASGGLTDGLPSSSLGDISPTTAKNYRKQSFEARSAILFEQYLISEPKIAAKPSC